MQKFLSYISGKVKVIFTFKRWLQKEIYQESSRSKKGLYKREKRV
jgi:hypothetical protein